MNTQETRVQHACNDATAGEWLAAVPFTFFINSTCKCCLRIRITRVLFFLRRNQLQGKRKSLLNETRGLVYEERAHRLVNFHHFARKRRFRCRCGFAYCGQHKDKQYEWGSPYAVGTCISPAQTKTLLWVCVLPDGKRAAGCDRIHRFCRSARRPPGRSARQRPEPLSKGSQWPSSPRK